MKSNYFQEQFPYSPEILAENLGIDVSIAQGIVKRLVLSGIAKYIFADRSEDWQDDVLHGKYKTEILCGDNFFKFVFVGLVEIEGHVLICVPKYMHIPAEERNHISETTRKVLQGKMKQVLAAIECYNSEHTNLDFSGTASQMPSNRMAIALHLILDFLSNGLYSNQHNELTLLGNGEIDWEQTINTTLPVISNNHPLYFEYYTTDTSLDEADFFARLHACIITECSKCLKDCDLGELLQIATPMPYIGEHGDFGTDEYICHRLQKEFSIQFVTQKQSLLQNMLAWIRQSSLSSDYSSIQLLGTNSFHTLWEAMCAQVFTNQYTMPINDLGIEIAKEFSHRANDTLESLIEKPQWTSVDSTSSHPSAGTLIPDYVSVVHLEKRESYFVILDAKYYDFELTAQTLKGGVPGVEDVCKQYLYQISYAPFICAHHLKSINAFICPTDESESKLIGTARMPLFSHVGRADCVGFKPSDIQVYKLSASELMGYYIANKKWPLQEAFKEFFK